ncbi:MAG: hypothetical protein A2W22_00745 [Candidatus Levybacteria bacterium RBG_16_35_11]|nr:MAG: hypothetical protein A2W22_00745 [Candidatus Levybacteria bacterium RBG_16_35_11]
MEPAQITQENLSPILIIDKEGIIGEALLEKLKQEALVIFISQKNPQEEENIIFIPFKDKPASIPDNTYSHIFVIDDVTSWVRSSLLSFAKKADEDKTEFIFISDLNKKDDNLIEDISRFHRAKVLILGDIFNKKHLLFQTLSNKFIKQAREEERVDVWGDGTGVFYPVLFEDAIEGIIGVVFGDDKNTLNYIFAKHPFSHLSFAHEIQKANPHIKIDFIKPDKEIGNQILDERGKFVLGDNYPLKET